MTADGKIAMADRAVASFSSRRDFEHLLELRARFRRLRAENGLAEYNLRIVASGSGSINPDAEVFRRRFSPVIVLTSERISEQRLNRLRAVADEVKICGKREIDFSRALGWLREKWKIKRLLCEGGGELNSALFGAGLVDRLHLTLCPKIFGGRDAPTIADGTGSLKLAGATRFKLKSVKPIGNELFLVYDALKANHQDVSEG